MINIETLNALIEVGALNLILLFFGMVGWLFWKATNYKPYEDVKDVIKKELLQRYYLKRQLQIVKSKKRINFKKEQYLIDKLDENYKKLVIAQTLLEQYENENN